MNRYRYLKAFARGCTAGCTTGCTAGCTTGCVVYTHLYIVEIRNFALFAAVTSTLTSWFSYTNVTCIPSRCIRRPTTNFLRQGFRKLSYYIQTDTHTDRHHRKREHAASRW